MTTVEQVINAFNIRTNITVDKACKIKKYITVEEKIELIKDFNRLVEENSPKYKDNLSLVAIVLFQLKIVQAYTDIKLNMQIEEYDKLQEFGVVDKVIEYIGNDYNMLKKHLGVPEY